MKTVRPTKETAHRFLDQSMLLAPFPFPLSFSHSLGRKTCHLFPPPGLTTTLNAGLRFSLSSPRTSQMHSKTSFFYLPFIAYMNQSVFAPVASVPVVLDLYFFSRALSFLCLILFFYRAIGEPFLQESLGGGFFVLDNWAIESFWAQLFSPPKPSFTKSFDLPEAEITLNSL